MYRLKMLKYTITTLWHYNVIYKYTVHKNCLNEHKTKSQKNYIRVYKDFRIYN